MVDTIFPAPNTYTPRQGRQANSIGFAGATAARPFGTQTGVRPGTSVTTVTATTTTVTCQPFAMLADVQTSNLASCYEIPLDGVATFPLAAQSASVPRSDIVYVQINDNQEDNTGALNSSSATRVYQAGTTVTIPTPPNTRTMVIAVINVPIVGSSPTVTWVAPYAVAAGGVLPVDTQAHLNAITGAPGQYADVFADAGRNGLYRLSGSAWVPTAGFADVRMTAAQNSVASVFTPVIWDTDASNAFGWHSSSVNPSRITVPYAGRYRVTVQLEGASTGASQYMAIGLRVNGTSQAFTQKVTAATSGNYASGTVTADLVLTAGSYIEVDGFQASALPMHVAQSFFQVSYVGAF